MGVDVGTTGCKAVVFDLDGKTIASAYREYPLLHPQPGWSELDIHNLWASAEEVVRETNSYVSSDPVAALSVSCQGEAVAPIDRNGNPLDNFSVSFDHRTVDQAKWWREQMGASEIFRITGMPLHAMHSINKIMWFKEHRREVFGRAAKFLCVEDYINFRLTGEYATDWSLAARTMAFDVIQKKWSPTILDRAGIDRALLPQAHPSGTAIGNVSAKLARELGFANDVLVATGGHDQPCGALGAGIIKPGMAMNATGTSDVICPAFNEPLLTHGMLENNYCCYPHTNPQQYVSIAFNLTGGLLLRWHRDVLCEKERLAAQDSGRDVYEVIIEAASDNLRSLYFLPHFVGAGTPYLDSHSRGALVGLTIDTTKEDISRAVLDSINYEAKVNIEHMNQSGCHIGEIRTIGGGAKSARWLQMKADTFGMPVISMKTSEAAALGAAILAGIAAGCFGSIREAVDRMVEVKQIYEPNAARGRQYECKYQEYVEIYPALRNLNDLLSREGSL
jgi:xylulokinase